MVRLSVELIDGSNQYINAAHQREIDLRGYKIPFIENMGATLDLFTSIDLSDNEIRKLDGFPRLKQIRTLLLNNNKISRLGDDLGECLPYLEDLYLTNNNLQELADLDPLSTIPKLTRMSLLRNPVVYKKHYRLYVIHKMPQIRILDFKRIKKTERDLADKLFKGKRGATLKSELLKRRTVAPVETPLTIGPSAADLEIIKTRITQAKSLEEVEKLKQLLQAGQIPGKVDEAPQKRPRPG